MTIREAAERIGVNPMTIRRWIRSGRLQARTVYRGGVQAYEIDPEALETLAPHGERAREATTPATTGERPDRTVEALLTMIDAREAEVRRLIAENARLTAELEQVRRDLEALRNARRPLLARILKH